MKAVIGELVGDVETAWGRAAHEAAARLASRHARAGELVGDPLAFCIGLRDGALRPLFEALP